MTRRNCLVTTLAGALLLAGATVLAADDNGDELRERHCLPLAQIDQIEVLDDQTLKFHMLGGPDYINHLPYRCTGLKNRRTFVHETSTSNYCDLDTITQIDTAIGMRVGTCPLGKCEAVQPTADDAPK